MGVVIFRSRLREEFLEAYRALAPRMLELARRVPGFLSYKKFAAEDGEQVSVIEFRDLDAVARWREHPEHRAAQALGREKFYATYSLQVCEPRRAYGFVDGVRSARVTRPQHP